MHLLPDPTELNHTQVHNHLPALDTPRHPRLLQPLSEHRLARRLGHSTTCEPTTHRSCFTDSTSFSFCRLGPTAHRSDGWRRQMPFATLGRSFTPVPPLPVSARQCR